MAQSHFNGNTKGTVGVLVKAKAGTGIHGSILGVNFEGGKGEGGEDFYQGMDGELALRIPESIATATLLSKRRRSFDFGSGES
jgi:hypothetical protein